MEIIPTLLLLICTEGYYCKATMSQRYIMPDWETCFKATETMAFNPVPDSLSTGKRYEMAFVVSAICVGTEKR